MAPIASSISSDRAGPWPAALVLALCAMQAQSGHAEGLPGRQSANASVYVRNDSDRTTVVTPRLRVASDVGEATNVELIYSVDIWSSASVDIRTSASRSITRQHTKVVEQRDEIDINLGHELTDLRLSGGYRYSSEPDYISHGGSLAIDYDFARKSSTLGLLVMASADNVGTVGEQRGAWKDLRSWGGRLSFTQAIDTKTLAQAVYELGHATGYLSSPYRLVGIGTEDGTCRGADQTDCLEEANPDKRVRHAVALHGRRALGTDWSVGVGYRFYLDNWALDSHTLEADVAWMPVPKTVLTLRYRLYVQSAASHYQPSYDEVTPGQHITRDKELSALQSHRVGLDLEHHWELDDQGKQLTVAASFGPTLYAYDEFPLLDSVTAWEATVSIGVEL